MFLQELTIRQELCHPKPSELRVKSRTAFAPDSKASTRVLRLSATRFRHDLLESDLALFVTSAGYPGYPPPSYQPPGYPPHFAQISGCGGNGRGGSARKVSASEDDKIQEQISRDQCIEGHFVVAQTDCKSQGRTILPPMDHRHGLKVNLLLLSHSLLFEL